MSAETEKQEELKATFRTKAASIVAKMRNVTLAAAEEEQAEFDRLEEFLQKIRSLVQQSRQLTGAAQTEIIEHA